MEIYKVKIRGLESNQFGPDGVWLTKNQLDKLLELSYDPDLCNKVVNLGGRYFKPSAFEEVLEYKPLKKVMESSITFNNDTVKSIAEDGHMQELLESGKGTSYQGLVAEMAQSGRYQLGESKKAGELEAEINPEGLAKLNTMKSKAWRA